GRSYWQLLSSSEGYSYYRPIPFLIWKALRDTQGHYDQATLHALPLLAHAIAGWCLFVLLRRLGAGYWAAFPALLFLTFPFHYQNVAIVGTLFHPLTGAAMLASLVLYERARARDNDPQAASSTEEPPSEEEPNSPSVILSRSEGSLGVADMAGWIGGRALSSWEAIRRSRVRRSFAAAQDDRSTGAVLSTSFDWSLRVPNGTKWHLAALAATAVALWTHESGVVVAVLIVLLEAVVLWQRGRRRPSTWVAAHLLAALLFVITWYSVEKAPFTDRTSVDELQPKALFFLQGFTWPLSAQTEWIQDNLGIPGGITIASIGLLDVGVAALLGVFAAYALSAWRVRRWDLMAVPAVGLAIGVVASAPALWRLSWAYVENSPRLLYLVAIGASIFWGLLPALRFENERLTAWWRVASSTLLLLVVAQSWRFVDVRMKMLASGTDIVNQIVATGETYEGRQILVMNAPSWFSMTTYEYPYGHLGVQVMPEYIGLDRVIYTSSRRSAEVLAESGTYNVDTSVGPYGFGPHGPEMTAEEIDALLRDGYELVDVKPDIDGYTVRDIGRIEPGGADPDLDHAGRIGEFVLVDDARVAADGDGMTVYIDWYVRTELARRIGTPASVTIVEVRDSSGAPVYTYIGDALAGYSSPMLWRPNDLIADSIQIPLPEDGTYAVYAGIQQLFEPAPMPAAGADGTAYDDGLLPIGEFVVTAGRLTSVESAP
ncbi:MAG TPA: hypothetical protein VFV93_14275, partial [Thermomicrobiales bacterium]|nr:hypothetical protein [Thermomicrobiales bacterium]